jgi:hypothetical protein
MRQATQDTDTAARKPTDFRALTKALDRILATSPADLISALRICLEISRTEQDSPLGVQAWRAHGALRRAQSDKASELSIRAAVRELEAVKLAILEAQRKPFGKIRTGASLTSERRLLGLPQAGSLNAKEINSAFRNAAHYAHPDHGGSDDRFVALLAARDALLREAK